MILVLIWLIHVLLWVPCSQWLTAFLQFTPTWVKVGVWDQSNTDERMVCPFWDEVTNNCCLVVYLLSWIAHSREKSAATLWIALGRSIHRNWGLQPIVTWMALVGDPKSPGEPSDDQRPGCHLDAHPMGDPESERPGTLLLDSWSSETVSVFFFRCWILGLFC